jgi:hypothetical protein
MVQHDARMTLFGSSEHEALAFSSATAGYRYRRLQPENTPLYSIVEAQ